MLDALAAAGITTKPSPGGAIARCPLPGHKHNDRNPSLSIQYIAQHERTRLRCHMPEHKGREDDILAAIGLGLRDLYDVPKGTGTETRASKPARPAPRPQQTTTPAPKPKSEGRVRDRVEATYDYLDAEGHKLLRVLRYVPKGFRQKKWDGRRWVWGAPAAEDRVLYRLPEVRAVCEAGGVIHLAEGEKDAEAIAAATADDPNFTATTTPMGADKWQEHYAEQLAGASMVHIWRDRDDAGTSQARTVYAALTAAGIPADVVQAAVDQDKADAADHLAAGFTLDQAELVDSVVYTEPEESAADPIPLRPTNDQDVLDQLHTFPMGRGQWGYSLDEGTGRRRGVWTRDTPSKPWRWVAPLPHVHARIIRRDGSQKRTSTDYLISAGADTPRVIVDLDQLRTATWANTLGMPLSADDKIQKAAASAIIHAAEEAPEQEATPRVDGGRITVPSAETLPAGYLATSRYSTEEAQRGWADLIDLIALSPKLALTVGASAVAPFVAATRRQSHIVFLYGDAAQGKTVALNTAGSVWGFASADPADDGATVVTPWNASAQGPLRFFGDLGVLPPVWDEIGQAQYRTPAEWGKFIYDVCEGGRRITPARGGTGTHYSKPWHGIFLAAGNGRILDGLGAGRYAGVNRRVIELPTPLTLDVEHAEAIENLWQVVYGHAGLALLHQHSAETVRPLIDAAATRLGEPDTPAGRAVARHLHSHIAGAAMLDTWAGTGTLLQDAATEAATEYLSQWAEPEHDADRMLNAIRDAIGREPAMWPTASVYIENKRPRRWTPEGQDDPDTVLLPQHGVDRSMSGLLDDNGQYVAVFTSTWKALCADLGLDGTVAARELHARGLLHVTEAKRRRGEWVTQVRAAGTGMYKLTLPDEDQEDAETPSGVGPVWVRCGSGVGTQNAVTSDVVGVVGGVGRSSRVHGRACEAEPQPIDGDQTAPCTVCGEPASHQLGGQPVHLADCADQLTTTPPATPEAPHQEPQEAAQAPQSAPASQHTASAPTAPQKRPQRREGRWSAPAAVLTPEGLHLPGGEVAPRPAIEHLGDLAGLTHPDAYALGWGGDSDRLPDPGQIWVTSEALALLDLPAELPEDYKARQKALTQLRKHPAIAGAVRDGWQIGGEGTPGTWTRIWHPEQHPGGAWIVALPWHNIDGVSLFADNPHPALLADRLLDVARTLGMPYRLTPAATGLDLIDHARPPKLHENDARGDNRGRVALIKNTPAELPPFLHKVSDQRFRSIEADFDWWRRWDTLGSEQERTYVHAYDRGASYLTPWRACDLGVADLTHREGTAATWDGKERPGYYRIAPVTWEHTHLPSPISDGAKVGDGTIWVTVHTLKQLRMVEIEAEVLESYTWGRTSRYLAPAGKRLGAALQTAQPGPTRDLVKGIYSTAVGKLGQIEHNPNYHLWRPDWRHHVIAHSRTGIWHTLNETIGVSGTYPLVVSRDLVVYASDDPDPASAWPGDPDRYGTTPGKWKHEGSALLAQWGPTHLAAKPGRWRYHDAITDLRKD